MNPNELSDETVQPTNPPGTWPQRPAANPSAEPTPTTANAPASVDGPAPMAQPPSAPATPLAPAPATTAARPMTPAAPGTPAAAAQPTTPPGAPTAPVAPTPSTTPVTAQRPVGTSAPSASAAPTAVPGTPTTTAPAQPAARPTATPPSAPTATPTPTSPAPAPAGAPSEPDLSLLSKRERKQAEERAARAAAAAASAERKQAKLDAKIAAKAARREARLRRGTGVGVVAAAALVSCLAGAAGGYAAALNAVGVTGGTQGDSSAASAAADGPSVNVITPTVQSPLTGSSVSWVEQVATKVQPSVVSLTVETTEGVATGSGVALTGDGYIVTNNHVVAGAGSNPIMVHLADATTVPATLVGTDPTYDIAVIKVGTRLQAATFDTSGVVVGEPVAAFGAPLGLYGTVTSGIVSATARPVTAGDGGTSTSIISAIQTDAAINPGNSGGALVDTNSQVVGLNSAIATMGNTASGSIGLGFAIPSKTVVRVAKELIADGTAARPFLGVSVGPTADKSPGALVEGVTANSPAAQAGLQAGDIIVGVDGVSIDGPLAAIAVIRGGTPGEKVIVTVLRNGQPTQVTVVSKAEDGTPATPTDQASQAPMPSGR